MVSLQDAPFTASSTWNETIPSGATYTPLAWPKSTGYNYGVGWDSYSTSVYLAQPTDPVVKVSYPGGWGYPGGTVNIHMPAAANGAAGTDGQLVVIDGDTVYDLWQFNRTSTTTATASAFGQENIVTGDGWGSKSPFLGAGITAVGASGLAGILVQSQTDTGSIKHALSIAVDSSLAKAGAVGQAISSDGGSKTGIVQEGQLLGIPPGAQMPAGLSPLGQEVFTALQKYGAYVTDVAGGTTNIGAQANAYDAATITALGPDLNKLLPMLQSVQADKTTASTGTAGSTSGSSFGSGSSAYPGTSSSDGGTGALASGSTSSTGTTGSTSGTSSGSGSSASPGTSSSDGGTGTSASGSTSGSSNGSTGSGGTSAGTSSGTWHHGTHHNPTSSDASSSSAHTWLHNSTLTSVQQALNSLSNTGSSGTPSSWHQHTSNWQYQDHASTLQVDNLQTHVHLTHHDFLVM